MKDVEPTCNRACDLNLIHAIQYDTISLCWQFISIVRTVRMPERQSSTEDRIKMTEILLDKLYSLGLINNNQSLEDLGLPGLSSCFQEPNVLKSAASALKQNKLQISTLA